MKHLRKLAAIMFTDIEGYSTMMQQDEDRAISVRQRHRSVLQSGHEQFNGRIIQHYGDGTLSIFQSAVEAVKCALAMQSAFIAGPQIPVRIGLHLGDIVCDEDNVYGDGVNLASRIESLGQPGSVLVSDRVAAEIDNHPELKTVSLGTYQFKNIIRQVEVFALNGPGLHIPHPDSLCGKTDKTRRTEVLVYNQGGKSMFRELVTRGAMNSVAVLPFINMSRELEDEHFGECLAEEVLTALMHIPGLKVAARTSSFKYRGKSVDLNKIGDKLGVSTVLEGCVRRHNGRLIFTVQLINISDGFLLWSGRYDRSAEDIFSLQEELASLVTQKLAALLPHQWPPAMRQKASAVHSFNGRGALKALRQANGTS